MGEQFFDDLSRVLATPMPRRQAVRFLGATFAGIWLAGFRPPRALADRDCSGQQICVPGNENCFTICCPHDRICCVGPLGGNRIKCRTNPHCCDPCDPNGSKCLGDGSCGPGPIADSCHCPPGQVKCGEECCSAGEVCSGGRCSRACPPGTTRCGTDCCSKNEQCTSIRVGPSSARVCVPRCPQGQALCGGHCCPKNWRCANPRTGLCKKCGSGQEECGKKCCPAGQFCCNPEKGICCKKKGESCCFTGPPNKVSAVCCHGDTECAPLGGPQGHIEGLPQYVCCPPPRLVPLRAGSAGSLCCPPGYRSLGGKLVVVAGAGGGLCCREESTCGSGKDITCCSSGTALVPEFRQICCSGRCVASMVDPQNCGGCGKVCASGQCREGTCV